MDSVWRQQEKKVNFSRWPVNIESLRLLFIMHIDLYVAAFLSDRFFGVCIEKF